MNQFNHSQLQYNEMKNVSVKLQTLKTTSVLSSKYMHSYEREARTVRTSEFLNTIHESINSLATAV